MTISSVRRLFLIGTLACACAAAPQPRPQTPARVSDTAPDKAAALRAGSGDLHQDQDEDRWAIEAARERKRRADQQKAEAASRAATLGPVDTRQPPAPAPPSAP